MKMISPSGVLICLLLSAALAGGAPVTLSNLPATNVGPFSATAGVRIEDYTGNAPGAIVYYGTADGGTSAAGWTQSVDLGQVSHSASGNLTGLQPGTVYFYRSLANHGADDSWAPVTSQFTTPVPVLPAIATQPATEINLTGAKLNAQVLSTGLDSPSVTFYYGPADGGTQAASWQQSVQAGLASAGAETVLSGLTPDTLYYFTSSAANSAGTSWSAASQSFRTASVQTPEIRTLPATNIRSNMARVTVEVVSTGLAAPTVTLFWGPVDGATNPDAWANQATLGVVDKEVSRVIGYLPAGQTLAFRAFASNSAGGAWSPSTQFLTTTATETAPLVVINEIHYDPMDRTKPQEFIELFNAGSLPVDLTGWQLTSAVDYTFGNVVLPPGGYFCVVESPQRFATTWPAAAANSAGPWTGGLRNSGETIELRDAGGNLINRVDYSEGFPWPTASAGGGPSLELLHPNLDPGLGGSWRRSVAGPTPGAVNSALLPGASDAPPAIRQVRHSPEQPASGVPVEITALVTDPDGMGSVNLRYQIVSPGTYIRKTEAAFNNEANWITVPMVDSGTAGDAVSGDFVFTAVLPATVQQHRHLIRYQITVTDALANSVKVPYADDEQPNFAYFVYDEVPAWAGAFRPTAFAGSPATPIQQFPADLLKSVEPWHLIANGTDVINCQYNSNSNNTRFYGTLVYRGKVYDHITYQVRGIGSTYVSGKNKWGLKFNRARNFQAYDNWGKPYAETWNSLGLNACASPWAAVNRGAAGIEEALSFRLFELGGVPSLRTNYVHWRVIRRAAEVNDPTTTVSGDPLGANIRGQYSGDLWGLYLALEPTEGNFLDERGLGDGSIFAIEGNNGDKKHQGETHPLNNSDWDAFRNANAQNGQNENWYRQNHDLEALFTFMGMSRLVGNVDVRPGDNFRYYHRPEDNRWVILPYDLDMMFIAAHHWGGSMDGAVVAGAPNTIRAISRHPAIALEYRNRCRELLSLMASDPSPNGGQIGQLIQEYARLVDPPGQDQGWADLDAFLWNLHPRSAGSGGNTGQSSHRGNFFRSTYFDGGRGGLGGTLGTGSWIRSLPDPDNDRFSDHEGMAQWFTDFSTNTYPPAATAWIRKATNGGGSGTDRDINRQKGYGYKYLEWESLYGGYVNANVNPSPATADLDFPNTPVIFSNGSPGFPANDLRFTSTAFEDPQGTGTAAAVQWRVGRISAPGIPGYDASEPYVYELQSAWTSDEIPLAGPAVAEFRIPATAVVPGYTYRARVRHKDSSGRWSFWSAPVQFAAGSVDTAPYQNALRITEIHYDPAPPTAMEMANPGWDPAWTGQHFEFLEIRNISSTAIDLTDVRFTKGIDYNFAPGTELAAGASLVIAKNPAAFAIRYGPGVAVAPGGYDPDSLSNGGEQLKLSYGAGIPIFDFEYGDRAPWPESPNGEGPSLVLISPETEGLDHGDPLQWRPGLASGGSPGYDDRISYEQWASGFPGTGPAGADDDGDGLVNLMEFALGASPATPSPGSLPEAVLQADQFLFIYTWNPGHGGVRREVEFSTGDGEWLANGTLINRVSHPDGRFTDTWQSPLPIGGSGSIPRQFARLRVSTP